MEEEIHNTEEIKDNKILKNTGKMEKITEKFNNNINEIPTIRRSLRNREGKQKIYNYKKKRSSLTIINKKIENNENEKSKKFRWYNQNFIMLLALRISNRPLPRMELIKRTLELDEMCSEIMNLPKCFHGKTPVNTASMLLTVNRDKLFIPRKPPGSRSTIFKLSFEPCNLEKAIEQYNEWNELLKGDWYWTFSKKRNYGFDIDEDINDIDSKVNKKGKGKKRKRKGKMSSINNKKLKSLDNNNSIDEYNSSCNEKNEIDEYSSLDNEITSLSEKKENAIENENSFSESLNIKNNNVNEYSSSNNESYFSDNVETGNKIYSLKKFNNAYDKNDNINIKKSNNNKNDENNDVIIENKNSNEGDKNDDSDNEFIPSSIDEIVEVKKSTIDNSGRGLFAKIFIPKYAVLGFYFGVPMTEWEFDSLKEGKGLSSNYSIRYRKTVLDATDDNGQPYWNNPKIFCPFHFMNENINGKPNVEFREGNKVNQVLIVAISNILPGEEIFVDYGNEVDRTGWGSEKFNNYAENFSDGNPNAIKNIKDNKNNNLTKPQNAINVQDHENENSILQKIKDNKNEANNNSQKSNENIKTDNSKLLLTLLLKISKDNKAKSENASSIEVDRFEELKSLLKKINSKETETDKTNNENKIPSTNSNSNDKEETEINNSINEFSNYKNSRNNQSKDDNKDDDDDDDENNENINKNNIQDNNIQNKNNKKKSIKSKSRSKIREKNNNCNNNKASTPKINKTNDLDTSLNNIDCNDIKRRKRGRPSIKKTINNEIIKNHTLEINNKKELNK